eukprot:gene4804-34558_t
MFLYTSETPFNKANNSALKKMANVSGQLSPPPGTSSPTILNLSAWGLIHHWVSVNIRSVSSDELRVHEHQRGPAHRFLFRGTGAQLGALESHEFPGIANAFREALMRLSALA